MKSTSFSAHFPAVCLAMLASLLTPACNTPTTPLTPTPQATRIAEHKADYDVLPAETRKQLAEGIISRGQSMKLVYLALGRPDLIIITPDAKVTAWIYKNYVPPTIATKKNVRGSEALTVMDNSNPLTDSFEAWRNGMQKHESLSDPKLARAPKAPTQTWADYGKFRKEYDMAGTPGAKAAIAGQARQEYLEAMQMPPIASPDPVKLDVIFVNQSVSDAIVNDSVSAFSLHDAHRPGTPVPDTQTPVAK